MGWVFFCLFVFILGAAVFSVRSLTGFDKDRSITGSRRINCSVRRLSSVLNNFLKSSYYMAIWPIPLRCFCTVQGWSSPTIVPCWKATTHTHTHTVISHKTKLTKLQLVTNRDLFTVKHQWKLEIREILQSQISHLFQTNMDFPRMVFIFLGWFIQTPTKQMQVHRWTKLSASSICCESNIVSQEYETESCIDTTPACVTCYKAQLRSLCSYAN